MAENKVRFLRGTAAEYAGAVKDDDTFYYTTDDEKFYVGSKEITGGGITVDSELSDTSENPVQNKVIKAAIDEKADKAVATTTADGLMSASDKGKLDDADNKYALKSKYGDTTIDVGRKAGTDVGINSTAEGQNTTASMFCSHAEGNETTASGSCSHAEGFYAIARGVVSHAEGEHTVANGDFSHTRGFHTIANNDYETASGIYNISNSDTLFSVGDGTADDARHNAFEITATGGKLHDKDIATTDLIPTSLPANGGNADTVDNKHYTDFSQNAVLSTIDQVNDPNLESGIYSAENVSMSFSFDVTSNRFMLIVNQHRASAGYGTQIAIPYDNGEQRGTFYRVCRAGNWGNWIRIADENIITNENLLLNPDFRINQQGKSEYTGTTECWDKWTVNAGWETARSADDIAAIFTCVTPQVNSWVVNQNIPNYKDYRGKTVTFSAQIVTTSTNFNLLIYDGVNQLAIPVTTGHFSVTYTVSDNATQLQCVICTNGQESKNEQIGVFSTKLELGTIATAFVPPNPSIELAKVRAVNDEKPYVTGILSEQANDSPVTMAFDFLNFTPSKVICQFGSGSAFFADVVTNGFYLTIPAGTTTIHYIAFK